MFLSIDKPSLPRNGKPDMDGVEEEGEVDEEVWMEK